MVLIDDVPKVVLATLLMGFSALALWAAFNQRSPAAILLRRLWSGRGRRLVMAGLALAVFAVVTEDVFFGERDETHRLLSCHVVETVVLIAPSIRHTTADPAL